MIKRLAGIAYEAYVIEIGGKAFNGDVLPTYDKVSPKIQKAWEAAVREVLTTIALEANVEGIADCFESDKCGD